MFSKTLVIRRVGGLEAAKGVTSAQDVIRRVGGLEDHFHIFLDNLQVIRRVGGLEGIRRSRVPGRHVIRRVGGLEVNVDAAAFFL